MSPHKVRGFTQARDGLLSHRKITPAQKAIYQRNAQQSSLLCLPVEVRQRIYELVLGGHHIQFGTTHLCRERSSCRFIYECAPISTWYDRPELVILNIDKASDAPSYRVKPLAGVCRQLHQETSLLWYQLNLFTFKSAGIMRRWLESLKPVQLRALRRLVLPWRSMHHGGWQQCLFHQHRKYLTGLFEVYDWNREPRRVERRWEGLNSDDKTVSGPIQGQIRRAQVPTKAKRARRNLYRGQIASRASARIKSLSARDGS